MVGWEGTIALDKATAARLDDRLERSALGDQFAFEEIVRQHQGMVFSMACHFLRDRSLAEELAPAACRGRPGGAGALPDGRRDADGRSKQHDAARVRVSGAHSGLDAGGLAGTTSGRFGG